MLKIYTSAVQYPLSIIHYLRSMLRQLSIQNYAIIDELHVDFCHGVNIITGETGAGKSILLGALSLLLGQRADSKALYDQAQKCVIEAEFDSVSDTKYLFEENDLDFDAVTIIRREIAPNGKSRAFINDTPVNLNVLKALGEKLVNMHTQHETLDLIEAGFQLDVLDVLAKNQTLLKSYKQLYSAYKKDTLRLDTMVHQYNKAKTELDFLEFQVRELNEAKLDADEQTQLESEQQTLENVENIKKAVQAVLQLIQDTESSSIDVLNEAQNQLKSVAKAHAGIAALSKRIENTVVELKDIATEFEDIQDSASLDPERLEVVSQRLSVLYRLQKKYNASNTAELITTQTELEQKIKSFDNSAEAIDALKKQIQSVENKH